MTHQHHLVPHEPRAPVVTVVSKSTVTQPGYTIPAGGYDTGGYDTVAAAPSPSYRVGPPVSGARVPAHQSVGPKPDHGATSRDHHRLNPTPSSIPNKHHISPGKSGVKEPAANEHHHHHHHHHTVGVPMKVDSTSPTSRVMETGPASGPKTHQDNTSAGLHHTTQDQGMSTGAKAGLAIGLLLALALAGAVVFLLYRRKKNQNAAHQPFDDEKTDLHKSQGSISSHVSVRRTVTNAPRLSLRPVTEMFPTMSEKSDSAAASTLIAKSAASARAKTPDTTRIAQANVDASSNPFGDDGEAVGGDDRNLLTAPAAIVPKPLSVKSERTGSELSDRSPQLNAPGPADPGAPLGAPRQSPPGPGPNNVHRVQLDFNPSMDDELGLRAGQLVRMLHEYDDGWALCIRLDRSQQGVVPRTCISKLPVKPRPQGQPGNMRGPPPQGRPRGPPNAPVPRGQPNDMRQRPVGAQGGRMRSQSNAPNQPQSQSPGAFGEQPPAPQARPRANSDAMSAIRTTPSTVSPPTSAATSPSHGSNKPSRKPVPGQAL